MYRFLNLFVSSIPCTLFWYLLYQHRVSGSFCLCNVLQTRITDFVFGKICKPNVCFFLVSRATNHEEWQVSTKASGKYILRLQDIPKSRFHYTPKKPFEANALIIDARGKAKPACLQSECIVLAHKCACSPAVHRRMSTLSNINKPINNQQWRLQGYAK